ncbi:MAG TPA: hypothetical protein PKE65_07615, partial [Rhizobiaceae bacterium]|nr:hypothetical protein [Rhizobiaceae bacterium]
PFRAVSAPPRAVRARPRCLVAAPSLEIAVTWRDSGQGEVVILGTAPSLTRELEPDVFATMDVVVDNPARFNQNGIAACLSP